MLPEYFKHTLEGEWKLHSTCRTAI